MVTDRAAINNQNRRRGKEYERAVAKLVGGERTPGSGAFKNSNRNLTGDVQVNDALGRGLCKIECKGVATISPKGAKTFTLKKTVLDQAFQEAKLQGEIGVVWIHFHGEDYLNDYVILTGDEDKKEMHGIIPARMFVDLLEKAKLGAVVQEKGVYP